MMPANGVGMFGQDSQDEVIIGSELFFQLSVQLDNTHRVLAGVSSNREHPNIGAQSKIRTHFQRPQQASRCALNQRQLRFRTKALEPDKAGNEFLDTTRPHGPALPTRGSRPRINMLSQQDWEPWGLWSGGSWTCNGYRHSRLPHAEEHQIFLEQ